MPRFFAPADDPADWQRLLAEPDRQWKTGYSARSLAHSWTDARGFPKEIHAALENADIEALHDLEFLIGLPEYEVPLPGGRRPSQNDIFVLARGSDGLVAMTVEGKVAEAFDLPVDERFADPTPGQTRRLNYLLDLLALDRHAVGKVGYQLLHRTASALIEAQRFNARHAVMLVHSFSQTLEHFDDFTRFMGLYGHEAKPGEIIKVAELASINLHLGWIVGGPEYLSR
jgi:hypothetical protein